MHIPPPVSNTFRAREFEESQELVELLAKLDADYVFAGDFHGYARTEVGKTTYLVTGGGGALLAEGKAPQFHHAVVIRVGRDYVSEQIIPVRVRKDLEDQMERLAISKVYPWLSRHRMSACSLNGVMLAAMVWLPWLLRRGPSPDHP